MSAPAGRWADLAPRVLSAAVMLAIGAVEIKLGGLSFLILITGLTAVMIWELARLTDKRNPRLALALAALAAVVMIADEGWPSISAWAVFPLVPLAFLATERAQRNAAAALATAIMISGHGLFVLRDEAGIVAVLWLLGVVITSDVMGYFVGRLVGGPKFWPAISPKKTWSGTVAGWIGAAALGGWFVWAGHAGWPLILLSPLIAFAGQMGDIAESWIKRKVGVKDASNLIPGHGGLMDRFDALVGAMVAVMVLTRFFPLPVGG